MYHFISTLLIFGFSVFANRFVKAALPPELNMPAAIADTVPKRSTDTDKWPAITAAEAQSLARQQGDAWKKSLTEKHILMGLGPNGPDHLQNLLSSTDSTTRKLYEQLMKTAELSLAKPLPDYYDPAYAMKKGQTAASAGPQSWMRPWGDQAVMLSVAAKVSNNPAYKQRLHDLVLRLCKFGSWGTAPLNADLATSHVARGIAMAWNWQPDLWSESERQLIIDTVRSRISMLTSGIYGNNHIWWAGSYSANVNQVSAAGAGICGVAFLNDIPEAKEWLAASWLNCKEVVSHSYPDGSSAEGTAYWTYGLSFIMQFIEASNGVLPSYTLYDSPFLKNGASYRIYCSTPALNEIISWGDSDPRDFSGPMHYLLRFASQYKNSEARYMATHIVPGLGGGEDVKAWAWLWSLPSVEEKAPAKLDYYASTSDIVNSRSGWKDDDYVLSFKSGYTNRSHSHLDAGSIGLIVGSDWLLPVPRYGKGKVNGDFWSSAGGRWKYQSNSTEANSTLIINKGQQLFGHTSRATIDHYASYDDAMLAECDLSGVYDGANSIRRRIFHKRGEYIIVQDAVALKATGLVEWLIQTPPNGVVDNNSINIQGKTGSVTVTLLSPQTNLSIREPMSENKDVAEPRNTLSAAISGSKAGFISVIEPKIHGRDQPEKTYSLTQDGTVNIKTAGSEEHLFFADSPSELSDSKTSVSASARFMYTKTEQDKLSSVILTDASMCSAGEIQLSCSGLFSGELIKADERSWALNIASGKSISLKGAAKIYKISGNDKMAISGQIEGPGNYIIQR